MFQSYVKDCKCVTEATSYLEILNYSVSCELRVAADSWYGMFADGSMRSLHGYSRILRSIRSRSTDFAGMSSRTSSTTSCIAAAPSHRGRS